MYNIQLVQITTVKNFPEKQLSIKNESYCILNTSYEPHHEKTGFLPMQKNKDADQLCSNCEADQHHCFRYTDSIIPF